METLMKPQLCVSSNATDDYLRYLRQMNISHCFVMFRNEETNYDAVNRTLERVRAAGLTVATASSTSTRPFSWVCLTGMNGLPSIMI